MNFTSIVSNLLMSVIGVGVGVSAVFYLGGLSQQVDQLEEKYHALAEDHRAEVAHTSINPTVEERLTSLHKDITEIKNDLQKIEEDVGAITRI